MSLSFARRWRRTVLCTALALLGNSCDGDRDRTAPVFGHALLLGLQDHTGIKLRLSHGNHGTTTDRYGYFLIPAVPRGEYVLTASHAGTAERAANAAVTHDGMSPSSAHLVLTPVGRLTGTVLSEAGAPILGATLEVLGRDREAVTVEGGHFVLDPAPAGHLMILASAMGFVPTTHDVVLQPGDTKRFDLSLVPSTEPDPYAENRPPTLSPITLTSAPPEALPFPIPLVDTSGGHVRRGGRYKLSVTATDPEGEPVSVFWSADRGTMAESVGEAVVWVAAGGTATIVCSAVDPYGATNTVRSVLTSTGDNIRGAGRHGSTIYYGERRSEDFDVYAYDMGTGEERVTVTGETEQHAVRVLGDWLVYAETEFVFTSSLVYRLGAQHLLSDATRSFGQTFGHDDRFEIRIDLYAQNAGLLIPYNNSRGDLAPRGYGFYDVASGAGLSPSPFDGIVPAPRDHFCIARQGNRQVWIDSEGTLFCKVGSAEAESIATVTGLGPGRDVQLFDDVVVWLPARERPLYWLDTGNMTAPVAVGSRVTSFALHGTRLAYVDQGPSAASVKITDIATGARTTLTEEPHFARHIWFLDDRYVIWGDQGAEGQAFLPLNTELLWIAEVF